MDFIILIKAKKDSEADVLPEEKLLRKAKQFNEELVTAGGGMVAREELHSRSKGKPVRFSGERRTVIDGPFAETKELIAGFWPWRAKSIGDENESVGRAPFDGSSDRTEIENSPGV